MTLKQWQKKLEDSVKNMKNFSEPLRLGAFDATAKMGERIFDEGKKESGAKIGSYSTKPIYISAAAVPKPKGRPIGKTGKSKFESGAKAGQDHKSRYFNSGYKGYRDNVGRQTSFVDLSLTGELRLDFGNGKITAEPRKQSDLEYQIRLDKPINQDKREGADEKYGTIFELSDNEKRTFYNTVQFEFNRRLKK